MALFCIAFTAKGKALADALAAAFGGEAMRCGQPLGLAEWAERHFAPGNCLVFVGAAGIAVRAIAPHLQSKTSDPAVVVLDENGRFAVPILSGHLGGANDWARRLAGACGAVPVLTTATDTEGVFAVDEWAMRQGCAVVNAEKIKAVSSKILAGGTVRVRSAWPVAGPLPAGIALTESGPFDVLVDVRAAETDALRLVPRIAVLGVGCKRGTPAAALEETFAALGLDENAVCAAATVDLKRDEPGLLAFCAAHGWPLKVYSAEQLRAVPGDFTASDFVRQITGVDNVCERAAVLAAGGPLWQQKIAAGGVTMAAACRPWTPDWRWQNG